MRATSRLSEETRERGEKERREMREKYKVREREENGEKN
jgi:hypothetical protein